MTWNEFEELVDDAIAELGENGSIGIGRIDVYDPRIGGVDIEIDADGDIVVTDD